MISASPTLVLLAVNLGSVFTAVVLIVMFLGWVMQVVQNQNEAGPKQPGGRRPNPPRPRPKPRPRDDRVASEIDAFLREVNSGRGNVEDDEPVIEVVRQPTRQPRRRPPERPAARPPERPLAPGRTPRPPQRRRSANTDTSDIEAHAEGLGSGLRTHVQDYMAEHLEQGVDQHLGDRAAEMPPELAVVDQDVHPLVARLREPEGARDAVLLAEILARPRTLRNR